MSTIKSSNDHLTLNADGTSKDIKFQADGVEKASISSAGAFTSTTIDATKLTGNLPALDGSALTGTGSPSITDNGNATAITIDSSERVGVGTTSPETNMHIFKGESGLAGAGEDIGLTIENNGDAGIQIVSPNNANNWIMFGDPQDKNIGRIQYSHSVDTLSFYTGDAQRVSILSGGGITFNGDTATANALDDYEEGDCSNISLNGSVSGNLSLTGKYIKIGNMVRVTVKGGPFSSSSFGGYAILSNLPFTIGASELSTYQAAFLYSLNTAYTHSTYWYATAGATSCNLYETRDGADSVNVTNTQFGTTYIRSTITYRTN